MKIGIFDVDSTIPNLALMKISSYYKQLGDQVEMYSPIEGETYDKVYTSKIFKEAHEKDDYILWSDPRWVIGGTGVDLKNTLPEDIEKCNPDYSLYDIDYNIGFAMRGCRLKCEFCVVPEKEGKAYSNRSVSELLTNPLSDNLLLLDNDYFGNPNWESVSKELIELKNKVSICQGINFRVLTNKQAKYLSQINFRDIHFDKRAIYTAWDDVKDEKSFFRGVDRVLKYGILPSHLRVYVLIGFNSTPDEDRYRVEKLRELGADPFVMPFDKKNRYQAEFARWVNNKAVFNSIPFEEYNTKKMKTSKEKREIEIGGLFAN